MGSLNAMTSEFVGRISVAVWIGKLSDAAAREALGAYAASFQRIDSDYAASLHEAILTEYCYRRDGQELCS